MAGAPKGNKNALKHGLYAARRRTTMVEAPMVKQDELRGPSFAIQYLEVAIDEIFARMMQAHGEEFSRLSNSLSLAMTSLFNGLRTINYLTGGLNPIEDALKELLSLDFDED